ncbi:hypothetical protein N9D31_01400 [Oligoflexaceae bacterium]|nr:hypothetical protein [Oligoflexaceae bacterium]
MLSTEYHIHLFGCITAEDLQTQIESFGNKSIPSLDWYKSEFRKAYGRSPDIEGYFSSTKPEALETLKADYLCQSTVTFEQFQASFNLAIALHPDRLQDPTILNRSFNRLKEDGITYAEFRIVLPPKLDRRSQSAYLSAMSSECQKLSDDIFTCRLAISLFRESPSLIEDYRHVKKWQRDHPALARYIKAVDFCMDEQNSSPSRFSELIDVVKADNREESKFALDVLAHAGEVFDRIGISISASWINKWLDFGVRRIGHGLSLGASTAESRPTLVPREVLIEHLEATIENFSNLKKHDLPFEINELEKILIAAKAQNKKLCPWPPKDKTTETETAWQRFTLDRFKSLSALLEICPTSNARLAPFRLEPIYKKFKKAQIDLVVSTDDPGIFATSLKNEIEYLTTECGWKTEDLQRLKKSEIRLRDEFPSLT